MKIDSTWVLVGRIHKLLDGSLDEISAEIFSSKELVEVFRQVLPAYRHNVVTVVEGTPVTEENWAWLPMGTVLRRSGSRQRAMIATQGETITIGLGRYVDCRRVATLSPDVSYEKDQVLKGHWLIESLP